MAATYLFRAQDIRCPPGYIEPAKHLPYAVYVGRQLPGSVTEEVLQDFFRKFRKVRGVSQKAHYAFIGFHLKLEAVKIYFQN